MDSKDYNPFGWLVGLFHIPKQSIFLKLKYFMFFMIVYSIIVGIIDFKFNIRGIEHLGQFHLLFSFCLSLIIGFRINIAYARWWEGRSAWGLLVNHSRNLALKFNTFVGLKQDPIFMSYLIKFPSLLQFHLYKDKNECQKIINELGLVSNCVQNLPTLIIWHIANKLNDYRKKDLLSMEQFLSLDKDLNSLTNILGTCERIQNTQMPKSFSIFTRFGLLFYMLIFPLGWVGRFGMLMIPIIMIIIYILLGLEVIAEEMENPFGKDAHDLPLEIIANTIENNIKELATLPTSH